MDVPDIRARLGLRPIINASGTATAIGASMAVPEAIKATAAMMSQFVEISDLQRKASAVIARLCATEAGFVTASCSAAVTVSVAGAMTGNDLAAIERLPDTTGLKDEVVILAGHLVHYSGPIDQAIRLAGAKVVPVGQATSARGYQLAGAINARTAAAVYVVSYQVVPYGMLPLAEFASIAHAQGVPVIVDGAGEYDLRGFLAAGGDLALYSSHKFLGGPTGGIVAGRKDLVRAAYLQNGGIGRGMKVGKEGIAGTIASLEAWERRDHAAVRAEEARALELWMQVLADRSGVTATSAPDPTHNPVDRLRLAVDAKAAHITAWDLADRLAAGTPPVMVRGGEYEHGYFYLDPCNLHPGEAAVVAERLSEELDRARASNEIVATSLPERMARSFQRMQLWPD